jgi:nucleoside diphosphate kinase
LRQAGTTELHGTIVTETDPRHRATQELIRQYILKNFTGEGNGQRPRALFLVFRGLDAVEKMHQAVGHIVNERTSGETIRDTFGDYITDRSGKVTYFEPGVLTTFNAEATKRDLTLWAEFSDSDGGILDRVIQFPKEAKVEKTLVLIKPDNFKFPNLRPGGVIEVFSRTGLYIVGFKVHRMSVAQAKEFYGPVLAVLEKLGPGGRENWERSSLWPALSQATTAGSTRRARVGKIHRARLPGGRRGAKNPGSARTDRSGQGSARVDSQGIRPNNHD